MILGPDQVQATGFRLALGNFIYRQWFQPYRSNINHNRFLAVSIGPEYIECSGIIPAA